MRTAMSQEHLSFNVAGTSGLAAKQQAGGIDDAQKHLLLEIAGLKELPAGAFNIRANGATAQRQSSEHVKIVGKTDVQGIDIYVEPGTKEETIYIPVVMSQSGIQELVYNDFHIGADADVTIIAGCGIDNCGHEDSQHDGIHSFFIEKGARVKYVEKHYGCGSGDGGRIMNPQTIVEIGDGGYMEMETVQIKGIDSTRRITKATLQQEATFVVTERLMTHGQQEAISEFEVTLAGEGSGTHLVSRAVAREQSSQTFIARITGDAACNGHSECDAIIMDDAKISAIPQIKADCPDASLIHEAAIGKIAGDQIIKLMTLGLTAAEAEEQIIEGFLK